MVSNSARPGVGGGRTSNIIFLRMMAGPGVGKGRMTVEAAGSPDDLEGGLPGSALPDYSNELQEAYAQGRFRTTCCGSNCSVVCYCIRYPHA